MKTAMNILQNFAATLLIASSYAKSYSSYFSYHLLLT